MTAQRSEHPEPLSASQLAVVERARQTPFTISRTHHRTDPGTAWTHEPMATLIDDTDVLALVQSERQRMLEDVIDAEREQSE